MRKLSLLILSNFMLRTLSTCPFPRVQSSPQPPSQLEPQTLSSSSSPSSFFCGYGIELDNDYKNINCSMSCESGSKKDCQSNEYSCFNIPADFCLPSSQNNNMISAAVTNNFKIHHHILILGIILTIYHLL